MSKYAGIKLVEWEASTGAFGGSQTSLGKPLADSEGVGFDPQTVENTAGNMLFAGNKDAHAFNIPDMSLWGNNDKVSSIKTTKGMSAVVYEDANYNFMSDSSGYVKYVPSIYDDV